MKLSKNKVSKLLRNKRQTRRRYKKSKNDNKNKKKIKKKPKQYSFRKLKQINIHNKTLKGKRRLHRRNKQKNKNNKRRTRRRRLHGGSTIDENNDLATIKGLMHNRSDLTAASDRQQTYIQGLQHTKGSNPSDDDISNYMQNHMLPGGDVENAAGVLGAMDSTQQNAASDAQITIENTARRQQSRTTGNSPSLGQRLRSAFSRKTGRPIPTVQSGEPEADQTVDETDSPLPVIYYTNPHINPNYFPTAASEPTSASPGSVTNPIPASSVNQPTTAVTSATVPGAADTNVSSAARGQSQSSIFMSVGPTPTANPDSQTQSAEEARLGVYQSAPVAQTRYTDSRGAAHLTSEGAAASSGAAAIITPIAASSGAASSGAPVPSLLTPGEVTSSSGAAARTSAASSGAAAAALLTPTVVSGATVPGAAARTSAAPLLTPTVVSGATVPGATVPGAAPAVTSTAALPGTTSSESPPKNITLSLSQSQIDNLRGQIVTTPDSASAALKKLTRRIDPAQIPAPRTLPVPAPRTHVVAAAHNNAVQAQQQRVNAASRRYRTAQSQEDGAARIQAMHRGPRIAVARQAAVRAQRQREETAAAAVAKRSTSTNPTRKIGRSRSGPKGITLRRSGVRAFKNPSKKRMRSQKKGLAVNKPKKKSDGTSLTGRQGLASQHPQSPMNKLHIDADAGLGAFATPEPVRSRATTGSRKRRRTSDDQP
jgi:hypothetical protein